MSPARFRECLALLNWSQRGLQRYLGIEHHRTVQRWALDSGAIPHHVADWLEGLAAAHAAAPRPRGWREHRPSRCASDTDP